VHPRRLFVWGAVIIIIIIIIIIILAVLVRTYPRSRVLGRLCGVVELGAFLGREYFRGIASERMPRERASGRDRNLAGTRVFRICTGCRAILPCSRVFPGIVFWECASPTAAAADADHSIAPASPNRLKFIIFNKLTLICYYYYYYYYYHYILLLFYNITTLNK